MTQRDVIILVLDDVGKEAFAQYRAARAANYGNGYTTEPHPYPHCPNIEKMAANGVTFTSFNVTPVCSPTRACALTGLYPWENQQGGLARGSGADFPSISSTFVDLGNQAQPTIRSMAHFARENGYYCIASGKWHLFLDTDDPAGGYGAMHPISVMGFDQWQGTPRNPNTSYTDFEWYSWDQTRGNPIQQQIVGQHLTQYTFEQAAAAHVEASRLNSTTNPEGKPVFHWLALNCAHAANGQIFEWPPDTNLGFGLQHNFGSTEPETDWANTRIRALLEHFDYWLGRFFASLSPAYNPASPTASSPVVFLWGDNGTDTDSIANVPGTGGSAPWPATEQHYPSAHPGWTAGGTDYVSEGGVKTTQLSVAPYNQNRFKGFPHIDGTNTCLWVSGSTDYVSRADAVDDSLLDLVDLFPTVAAIMVETPNAGTTGTFKPTGARASGTVQFNLDGAGNPYAVDGETVTVTDAAGTTVVFELSNGGALGDATNTEVIYSGVDVAVTAASFARAVNGAPLRVHATASGDTATLTAWHETYDGNQTIVSSNGTEITVSGFAGGRTAPPALSGVSFAHRLTGTGTAVARDFSANGIQFRPNGVSQPRTLVLANYTAQDGDANAPQNSNRWALVTVKRTENDPEEYQLFNTGAGVTPQAATGSIQFLGNPVDGDLIRLSDDYRHDASDGFASGTRISYVARTTPGAPGGGVIEYQIGGSAAASLANLKTAIDGSGQDITTGTIVGDTLPLTNSRQDYGGNDHITRSWATGGDCVLVGMGSAGTTPGSTTGQAQDMREEFNLNSPEYLQAHGGTAHPQLAILLAAEAALKEPSSGIKMERRSMVISTGHLQAKVMVRG